MTITSDNINIVNNGDIYVHDYIFESMKYDYNNKHIEIGLSLEIYSDMEKIRLKHKIGFMFYEVIGFEMISCAFWGSTLHIYDLECISSSNSLTLNKYIDEKNQNNYSDTILDAVLDEYFEVIFYLSSGDRLNLVCKKMDIIGYKNYKNIGK